MDRSSDFFEYAYCSVFGVFVYVCFMCEWQFDSKNEMYAVITNNSEGDQINCSSETYTKKNISKNVKPTNQTINKS